MDFRVPRCSLREPKTMWHVISSSIWHLREQAQVKGAEEGGIAVISYPLCTFGFYRVSLILPSLCRCE